jgi:hypothetical protein
MQDRDEAQPAGSDWWGALDWELSVPGEMSARYGIHAAIGGPGVEPLRAEVEALVASITYHPPAPVLNTSDAPRFAKAGVESAIATDAGFSCFPTVPGIVTLTTVSKLPFYLPLSKPLPVACATDIGAVAGFWKLTLTESWTAASDRSAGGLTRTIWLEPDGTPGWEQGGLRTPAEVPYLP